MLRKIKNRYYISFYDIDGTRRTRALGTADPARAKELYAEYLSHVENMKFRARIVHDFPDLYSEQAPITAAKPSDRNRLKLTSIWELAQPRRALSNNHRKIWDKFLERTKLKYADEVTPKYALNYLNEYYSEGNGKTYNNIKSALNTVFRCCLVEAGLSESPFKPIFDKRVTDIDHHRNITLEEFDQIFAIAPIQLQIAMMLSRWTAQRLETVTRMTPAMFDFERLVFLIDPGKNKRFNEWVCVPIFPELEKFLKPILKKCSDPEKPIVHQFSEWKNTRYTNVFSQLIKQLNIPDEHGARASFHSLRGTAITWFKEHGIKGDDLQSITGHDSKEVEDIYARDIASISRIAAGFRSVKIE
jgi:hypothetical protein